MIFADFPYLADWFSVAFRWLAILGVSVALAYGGALAWPLAVILLLAVLWNLFISMLAALNLRLPQHRPLNVGVDLALSLALFGFSGGLFGPLVWASLLALLSAAVYYEWRGSLAIAGLLTLGQAALSLAVFGLQAMSYLLVPLAIAAVLNLVMALVFGIPSRLLIRSVREIYQERVSKRRSAEMAAQKQEHDRMQAFYSLIESLSATLDYQSVLDYSLDLSAQSLGLSAEESNRLVSAVLLFGETDDLSIGAGRHLTPSDLKRVFPATEGALDLALHTGEPQRIQQPSEDPELGNVMAFKGCESALVLPLLRGLNAYGVMIYAHPDPDFFTSERAEMLEMLSHQAVIAIQNARLFQEINEEKERLQESQDEARKKLARDLHDGPTQSISSIAMRAAVARKMLEHSPDEVSGELEWIENMARRTTEEIRHMLFALRPLVLEKQGLLPALEEMAAKMNETFHQNVRLDVDPVTAERLDDSRQSAVFYLTEEAVNNARKHAQATQIIVRLRFFTQDQSIVLLEVADNGLGFDVAAVSSDYERRGSLGMVNLRERAEMLNAYLNLQSAPGKGTRVQIFIPLTALAVDRLQRGMLTQPSEA